MWKKKNCIKGKSDHKNIPFAKEYQLQLKKKKKRQAKTNKHLGDLSSGELSFSIVKHEVQENFLVLSQ